MAKDPAVLFYTSDFLSGTLTMNNEEVGKYIKLLCLQHQKGRLTEKDMLCICSTYVEDVYSKFIKDDNGLYYNERMEKESIRRKNYSLSRKKNVLARYEPTYEATYEATYVKHMETETETENRNVNINKRYRKPTLKQVENYCKERKNTIDPETFFDYYESSGWVKANGQKVKDWKATIRTWEKNELGKKDKKYTPISRINFKEAESMIARELGKIATKPMVKAVMNKIDQKCWWMVDKFLKERYRESNGSTYLQCESELVRENQNEKQG